ncbi:hypothetical protein [Algibacter sp. 2305UL17-15]|uniref:hypothetical protein n=1 Tax=Algibacter sp. 2305UL17-15 TaxID=3231268 RepID=UPI00345AB6FD
MKTFLKFILFGGIGIVALILLIGVFASNNDEKLKTTTYDIQENPIFSESLDSKKDYEDGSYTVRYETLAENLKSTHGIRTKEYEFQFRKGFKELHVIPILENGKTNSENRIVYETKFGGVIPRHLAFGLTNKENEKGIFDVQFDSEINPEKVVVVKYSTDKINFCKRGVVYDIMNHKGKEY